MEIGKDIAETLGAEHSVSQGLPEEPFETPGGPSATTQELPVTPPTRGRGKRRIHLSSSTKSRSKYGTPARSSVAKPKTPKASEAVSFDAVPPAGTLVWAKVKGYPWWPGKIVDASELDEIILKARPSKAREPLAVQFFDSWDYQWFTYEAMRPFEENMDLFAGPKEKRPQRLSKAIRLAEDAEAAEQELKNFLAIKEREIQHSLVQLQKEQARRAEEAAARRSRGTPGPGRGRTSSTRRSTRAVSMDTPTLNSEVYELEDESEPMEGVISDEVTPGTRKRRASGSVTGRKAAAKRRSTASVSKASRGTRQTRTKNEDKAVADEGTALVNENDHATAGRTGTSPTPLPRSSRTKRPGARGRTPSASAKSKRETSNHNPKINLTAPVNQAGPDSSSPLLSPASEVPTTSGRTTQSRVNGHDKTAKSKEEKARNRTPEERLLRLRHGLQKIVPSSSNSNSSSAVSSEETILINWQKICDVITQVENFAPMTVELLRRTKIGKVIRKLKDAEWRSEANQEAIAQYRIKERVAKLLDQWKRLHKQNKREAAAAAAATVADEDKKDAGGAVAGGMVGDPDKLMQENTSSVQLEVGKARANDGDLMNAPPGLATDVMAADVAQGAGVDTDGGVGQ